MWVIAGVTGHVGSVVAGELLAKNQKVKVIVRDAARGAAWSQKGAEIAVGSLTDQAFLTGALKGASGLFTLLPPDFGAPDFYAAQRKTADAIAGAVKAAKVPHVVILSSVGADLPDGTGPIKGLNYLENALKATGTVLTAVRAGLFQENVGNAIGAAKNAGIYPHFVGSPDTEYPMIATEDIGRVAAGALLAPSAKSEVIDLHGPAYSAKQIAAKLGEALGKPVQVVEVPQAGWLGAMTQAGIPPQAAAAFTEMYGALASGVVRPKGDRLVQGKTPIDAFIKSLAQ